MAKPNYTRIEHAFEKGVRDLKVKKLLREAGKSQGKSLPKEEEKSASPRKLMKIIEQDLKWLNKQKLEPYKKLEIKRSKIEELIKLVNIPDVKLREEELLEIKSLKEAIDAFKKDTLSSKSEEDLVNEEIDRHINKRHNLREKWLPLDTHSDWDKYKKKNLQDKWYT